MKKRTAGRCGDGESSIVMSYPSDRIDIGWQPAALDMRRDAARMSLGCLSNFFWYVTEHFQ
ncbi:hypothetical protein [Burkholderia sp. LMG 13014]|uniref:hypothetical protein n=1 Tax=Burkholderia sp. LMG 13014 TaxID=2709306 RepID=UPI001965BDFD|nr:hypothetical protein [Burkholderia sp. LMG 13014]